MTLTQWAIRHNVSNDALADLRALMLAEMPDMPVTDATTEAGVLSRVRLEASSKGVYLWRNNVGACYDADGNFIRYGLANDSEKLNAVFKSSDLIGGKSLTITPDLVGCRVMQMVVRECKKPGWRYSATERELAQLNFINLILSLGGDAQFCTGEGTL